MVVDIIKTTVNNVRKINVISYLTTWEVAAVFKAILMAAAPTSVSSGCT